MVFWVDFFVEKWIGSMLECLVLIGIWKSEDGNIDDIIIWIRYFLSLY